MDLKPGYQQTDAGVIPEEWEVCPVAQKGEIVTGKALAVNGPGRQRPYLRTKNVFDGRIDIDDVLTMPMTDEQFANFRIRQGDVLLNEGQSLELVGRCAMYQEEYPEPCAIQNQLIRFRARTAVSGTFASYLFRHCQQTGVFARIALQTTSIAHLGGSRFGRLLLAWPKSENEQRAIAAALCDADALLDSLDRLIAKKRDLKQAVMQQLLTGQTRLPGFHGEWVMKTFGGVTAPRRDKIDPKRAGIHDFCIELEHIESGSGQLLGSTSTGTQSSLKSVFRSGDVLFGKLRAYLRKYWRATRSGVCSTEIWVLVPRDEVAASEFLFQIIQTNDFIDIASNSYGTHMPRSDWNVVKNHELKIPPLHEQTAIAGVLSDMDAELAALEQRRDKTRALKQGMMQELLTGRTRLV
jgi:type I restriction enzyme S subunit